MSAPNSGKINLKQYFPPIFTIRQLTKKQDETVA